MSFDIGDSAVPPWIPAPDHILAGLQEDITAFLRDIMQSAEAVCAKMCVQRVRAMHEQMVCEFVQAAEAHRLPAPPRANMQPPSPSRPECPAQTAPAPDARAEQAMKARAKFVSDEMSGRMRALVEVARGRAAERRAQQPAPAEQTHSTSDGTAAPCARLRDLVPDLAQAGAGSAAFGRGGAPGRTDTGQTLEQEIDQLKDDFHCPQVDFGSEMLKPAKDGEYVELEVMQADRALDLRPADRPGHGERSCAASARRAEGAEQAAREANSMAAGGAAQLDIEDSVIEELIDMLRFPRDQAGAPEAVAGQQGARPRRGPPEEPEVAEVPHAEGDRRAAWLRQREICDHCGNVSSSGTCGDGDFACLWFCAGCWAKWRK